MSDQPELPDTPTQIDESQLDDASGGAGIRAFQRAPTRRAVRHQQGRMLTDSDVNES